MSEHIELNPASHITVGTIGEPGNRTFYLQGSQGRNSISLIIEKQQASMLAEGLESLFRDLAKERPELITPMEPGSYAVDLRLRQPLEALYRVGRLGLGYSEESHKVIIAAYELVDEEEEPSLVSYWGSVEQMQALVPHVRSLIKSGRPICGNCGLPIDKDGHFCAKRNGYH